jgi:hypothetical protein
VVNGPFISLYNYGTGGSKYSWTSANSYDMTPRYPPGAVRHKMLGIMDDYGGVVWAVFDQDLYAGVGKDMINPAYAWDVAGEGTCHAHQKLLAPIIDVETVSWADLAIDSSDNAKMRSNAKPFNWSYIGKQIQITGGTGFTPQTVTITDIGFADGNIFTATCDHSLGTVGSTGGIGVLQGSGIYFNGQPVFVAGHPEDVLFLNELGLPSGKDRNFYYALRTSQTYGNISGATFTRESGDSFATDGSWNGRTAVLALTGMTSFVKYTVDHVTDADTLVLTTSVGTYTDVGIAVAGGNPYDQRTLVLSSDGALPEDLFAFESYSNVVLHGGDYCSMMMRTTGNHYAPWLGFEVVRADGSGGKWTIQVWNDDFNGLYDVLGKFSVQDFATLGGVIVTIHEQGGWKIGMGRDWDKPDSQVDIGGDGTLHVRNFATSPQYNVESIHWTDLQIDPSDNTKLISMAHPLGYWMRNKQIQITGGTGFTPQTVTITDIDGPSTTQDWYMTGATIHTPGSGYHANDIVTVSLGSGGTVKILTVDGSGVPLTISVITGGGGMVYLGRNNVATTGGFGAGLTLDVTTYSKPAFYKAKCSAVIGTVGSTGGFADLLCSGIYFSGYDIIDMPAGLGGVRILADLHLIDAASNPKDLHCGQLHLSAGIYVGGYPIQTFASLFSQIFGDLKLHDGTYYRDIDLGSIHWQGGSVLDGYGILHATAYYVNPSSQVIDSNAHGHFVELYANTYGGGGYELGGAVSNLDYEVAYKVDKITVAAHTMTIPKLTTLGTAGSISWNTQGQVTSWVDPT